MITASYGRLDDGPDAVITVIVENSVIAVPKLSRLIYLLPVISLDGVLIDLLSIKFSSKLFIVQRDF